MNTPNRRRLIDELVEAYVHWREACTRVQDAYCCWVGETGARSSVAFVRYRAALDEEQRAAEVYARFVRRADELPWCTADLARPPDYASSDSVNARSGDGHCSPNEGAV